MFFYCFKIRFYSFLVNDCLKNCKSFMFLDIAIGINNIVYYYAWIKWCYRECKSKQIKTLPISYIFIHLLFFFFDLTFYKIYYLSYIFRGLVNLYYFIASFIYMVFIYIYFIYFRIIFSNTKYILLNITKEGTMRIKFY